MGDVIKLKTVRKERAGTAKGQITATNRAKFGRTKAERRADEAEAARREEVLDAAKRDRVTPIAEDGSKAG